MDITRETITHILQLIRAYKPVSIYIFESSNLFLITENIKAVQALNWPHLQSNLLSLTFSSEFWFWQVRKCTVCCDDLDSTIWTTVNDRMEQKVIPS